MIKSPPPLSKRTRLDDNLDAMRNLLASKGATLETALKVLHKLRRERARKDG